jgi:(E)-4-hydroxy-3-methylbut-2-enyl-diphosphate synthase
MCDTRTTDVQKTVRQIKQLEKEGCDIVRVAIPDLASAKAIPKIKKQISIPLVADIHFDPALAIESIRQGADKIRINPGNISDKKDVKEIIKEAKRHKTTIRIGVNSGSLEPEILRKHKTPTVKALVESAMKWVKFFEKEKFKRLVVSIKSPDPETVIEANRLLAKKTVHPLHLGVTEAGTLIPGITKSTLALGTLLKEGIGDTIRISLTEDPVLEIKAAKELLKNLGLYTKEPIIISCPTCARTEIDLKRLVKEIEEALKKIKFKPRKKPLRIAVMGCVVNGPGEAREATYAICGGKKKGAIYHKGKLVKIAPENTLVKSFIQIIKNAEN